MTRGNAGLACRPGRALTLMGAAVLPLLALALIGWGAWSYLTVGSMAELVGALIPIGLGILAGAVALITLRGWFALWIDPSGLANVGLFGSTRFRLDWAEVDAVGLTMRGPFKVLTVRTAKSWPAKPDKALLGWDPRQGLLQISGVDNWSKPAVEIAAAIQHHAGPKWTASLTRP